MPSHDSIRSGTRLYAHVPPPLCNHITYFLFIYMLCVVFCYNLNKMT
jgi:hypothetical protein